MSVIYITKAISDIIKKLNLGTDTKILDAGCGDGSLINIVHNFGFANLWSFDISKDNINTAKKSFPKIADRFFEHDAYELNLPVSLPKAYDLILSVEVIEHLYEPTKYVQNLYNWLNRDGYLIISTPYHGYLKNLIIALVGNFNKHYNQLYRGGHIKFFSRRTLTDLLNTTGFHVTKFKGAGRIPYIWKSMILVAKKPE